MNVYSSVGRRAVWCNKPKNVIQIRCITPTNKHGLFLSEAASHHLETKVEGVYCQPVRPVHDVHVASFGLSRLIPSVAGKRVPEEEAEAQKWIETVIGERFPPGKYEDVLRDGIILCKLMNKLAPGSIQKINTSGGDYKMMDNISQFQKACTRYGVADVDLFQSTDLWDQKNITLVTQTIFALGRASYKHKEWRGPYLGPRPAEENKREFTEEQLRAGEAIIGLQAGTNRGATQSGQSFGATRKILLGK